MKWTNLVPEFIKQIYRPIYWSLHHLSYRVYRKIIYHPKKRSELHQYWKDPYDGANLPQGYLEGKERSELLLGIIKRYTTPDSKILEIGCNVGRNLNHLSQAGFKNLEAIEISENAIQLLKKSHPEMASHTKIHNTSIEDIIKEFGDNEFDIVFTMAVLEHIHKDSEWIFSDMVRITKDCLIVVEDEHCESWRHFPRNYKKIFERLGMKQIEEINCADVGGLSCYYFARIFK